MIIPNGKKILIITEVFAPEDFLINDLAFAWKKQGFQVSVLTRNPSYPNGQVYPGYKNHLFHDEIINDIPIFRVQFIPGYKNFKFLKILNYLWNMILGFIWAIRNGRKFDTIYIYHTGPLTFPSIGILIKKLYKKQTIIWTQDVWPDTVYAYGMAKDWFSAMVLEYFVKWIYKNCDSVTVSCPGYVSIVSKYCKNHNVKFIPQWSLTKKKTELIGDTEIVSFPGKFNFVFAGNIGKVQNLENVILGFDDFNNRSQNKEVWLNIIGDGSDLDNLKNRVSSHKIANVKFWGRINSSKIPYFLDKADVLIIALLNKPIFNLTIPAKFQSYLNAEKPIFGVISGEVADLINSNNLGWVANPEEILGISDSFKEISECTEKDLHEKIINMSTLLEDKFNREKNIAIFTEIVFG
jgi:glycosyltransferase involved in cell wall biosynthesis